MKVNKNDVKKAVAACTEERALTNELRKLQTENDRLVFENTSLRNKYNTYKSLWKEHSLQSTVSELEKQVMALVKAHDSAIELITSLSNRVTALTASRDYFKSVAQKEYDPAIIHENNKLRKTYESMATQVMLLHLFIKSQGLEEVYSKFVENDE